MKRKLLVLGMAAVMVLSMSVSAFAVTVDNTAVKANTQIYNMIERAQDQAAKNPKRTDSIIEKLITQTEKVAARAVMKSDGALEIEYVEVVVGDQTVLVDPLVVGGW